MEATPAFTRFTSAMWGNGQGETKLTFRGKRHSSVFFLDYYYYFLLCGLIAS